MAPTSERIARFVDLIRRCLMDRYGIQASNADLNRGTPPDARSLVQCGLIGSQACVGPISSPATVGVGGAAW
jgi:hypothetical protein